MPRVALPFPALPGTSEADLRRIADHFASHPAEYAESRRRLGVTLERAYLQRTPMGSIVVACVEASAPFSEVSAQMAASDLAIDRFFVEAVRELHGIDLTQPGPAPEVIAEWTDPLVTRRLRGMAFCAPMIPGTEDRGRAWSRETFASEGMTTSRRALKQSVELVTLVPTPDGPVIAVYVEGEDPFEGNRRFAESTEPFDVAFKEELTHLFPPFVDFSKPVPDVTEIFDSEAILAVI